MIVRQLSEQPEPELARALAEFETVFSYPLGPGRSFRISHGDDYPRFFRAMGEAACFVAENQGRVLGTVGAAVRELLLPDGSELKVGYVGDLKVTPEARTTFAFIQLAFAAQSWLSARVSSGFGVVMGGTAVLPSAYMGRVGLPGSLRLGQLDVLRIACAPGQPVSEDERYLTTRQNADACYRELCRGRYGSPGGFPEERSQMPPVWLLHPDGLACGRLEDTRRAKRLTEVGGGEMVSGHLAAFAFKTPQAGADLIRVALRQGRAAGLPALFVSVAEPESVTLRDALGPVECVVAPATVFGVGLDPGPLWAVNSSEI
jgi:hypothetical protein